MLFVQLQNHQAESDISWITGEVVVHLLRRSTPPVSVLRMSRTFFESNVTRVVKEIGEYCGFTELLMESREVQDLLKAARNLDNQKMEGGGQGWTPRPAPPRGKTGCPAPPRPAKSRPCPAPPRPAKLTKSAGRSGAKLTADFIDTPFYYARD